MEKILPDFYRIEVPLPNNPLRAINSYVIVGPDRNLIIDTGMNREECRFALESGLAELGVDLGKTDFFITHMHADHSGLVGSLAAGGSRIYCSQPDAGIISIMGRLDKHWDKISEFARINGFPAQELKAAVENHPGYKYSARGRLEFSIVKEGDAISAGEYTFTCVATPGHTRGHVCLYEPGKKLLVAGDHLLGKITPNISALAEGENPLADYLQSLEKIYAFDIALVLPGHRGLFSNHWERVRELKHHHDRRAKEILAVLTRGAQNVFQVAAQMRWDMSYAAWEEFPVAQKWFATGEVIAHLQYLAEMGLVRKEKQAGIITYSLAG